MGEELLLSKEAETSITQRELDAYRMEVSRHLPPLSPSTAAGLYALFLRGNSCDEIARLNPGFNLGIIIRARIENDWDSQKALYIKQLLEGVRERVKQAELEAVEYSIHRIAAEHKLKGDKLKKYLQTGDPTDLHGLEVELMGTKGYKEAIENLLKITGQAPANKQQVSGDIFHHHVVDPALVEEPKVLPPTPADTASFMKQFKEKTGKK
jgi:hypothetical protein